MQVKVTTHSLLYTPRIHKEFWSKALNLVILHLPPSLLDFNVCFHKNLSSIGSFKLLLFSLFGSNFNLVPIFSQQTTFLWPQAAAVFSGWLNGWTTPTSMALATSCLITLWGFSSITALTWASCLTESKHSSLLLFFFLYNLSASVISHSIKANLLKLIGYKDLLLKTHLGSLIFFLSEISMKLYLFI